MPPQPIERWQKVCGRLPGGPAGYTYVPEHCRRKRTSQKDAAKIAEYERDLQELAQLLSKIEAIVHAQNETRRKANPLRWDARTPPTTEAVNAKFAEVARKDQQSFAILLQVPEVISQIHEGMLKTDASMGTLESRFQQWSIPRKFQSERATIALGVFRALDITRRRQLADLGVIVQVPSHSKGKGKVQKIRASL